MTRRLRLVGLAALLGSLLAWALGCGRDGP